MPDELDIQRAKFLIKSYYEAGSMKRGLENDLKFKPFKPYFEKFRQGISALQERMQTIRDTAEKEFGITFNELQNRVSHYEWEEDRKNFGDIFDRQPEDLRNHQGVKYSRDPLPPPQSFGDIFERQQTPSPGQDTEREPER
jgi:hypothetical protein